MEVGGRGEGEQVRAEHGQRNRPDAGPRAGHAYQEQAEDIMEGKEVDGVHGNVSRIFLGLSGELGQWLCGSEVGGSFRMKCGWERTRRGGETEGMPQSQSLGGAVGLRRAGTGGHSSTWVESVSSNCCVFSGK